MTFAHQMEDLVNIADLSGVQLTGIDSRLMELERLRQMLTPPEGYDFTISRDKGRWLVALWPEGKPGGGRHCHAYGETLEKAWIGARAALSSPYGRTK